MPGLTPAEQALSDQLNQRFPRGESIPYEEQFRSASIDRQADEVMRSARSLQQFHQERLFVPSEAEMQYRAGIRSTPVDGIAQPTAPAQLEGITQPPSDYRPSTKYRQVSQTPTDYRPSTIERTGNSARPSTGSPPPTPKTSGAGALGTLMSTGAPRTPITSANPLPGALPSGLPDVVAVQQLARGAVKWGGIGAGIDFASRLISGQPVDRAAVGAAGSGAGSVVGGILGSTFGPIGSFAGGMIGGAIGGKIAESIYAQARPSSVDDRVIINDARTAFSGGQGDRVLYTLNVSFIRNGASVLDTGGIGAYGPIGGIRIRLIETQPNYYIGINEVLARPTASSEVQWFEVGRNPGQTPDATLKIRYVTTQDGKVDYARGPSTTTAPLPPDTRPPISTQHPGNREYAVPSGTPAAGRSLAPNNYAIGGLKDREGGTPRGDSPTWVTHGVPAGSTTSDNMPGPLGPPLPTVEPVKTPTPTGSTPANSSAADQAYPAVTARSYAPGTAQTTPSTGYVGEWQGTGNAKPAEPFSVLSQGVSSIPSTVKPNATTPDAQKPVAPAQASPGAAVTTTPSTTTTTATKTDLDKFRDELDDKVAQLGLGLVAITKIVQGIATNTVPEAIETAAAAGTCRTTEPGGCTSNLVNNAAANTNSNLGGRIDAINSAGQDLALAAIHANTTETLTRLGPAVPGGISGFLGKFAKSIHLDKILNALTLITALHNAAMLSRNLGSTLGEVASQALTVIGIKDENDSPIDINEILGKQTNSFMESLLGADAWKGIKTTWNKASTIISTTTQILSSVRGLWDSSKEILEWTAENTGKIGNALKRFRVVGEKAYGHMPEHVTAQNAWSLKIDRFRSGTDNLDDAASSLQGVLGEVQSIQEEFKDLKEQKERFDKNVADLTPKTRPDNKPVADAVAAGKAASTAPADAANVFRGEGEKDA